MISSPILLWRGGHISLISQIWCDVPLLLNFSIGDLCSSCRSLDTFTLVFLSRFLVLWEWGPNLILKTPKAFQHGKHLLWLRVWVFGWKKHNSYQFKWHKKVSGSYKKETTEMKVGGFITALHLESSFLLMGFFFLSVPLDLPCFCPR